VSAPGFPPPDAAGGGRRVDADMFARVRAGGLLGAGRSVVVLLSGGRDSTCLLDLAVRVAGAGEVTALHVNYGLRVSADADERHCVRLCERLGLPLEVRRPKARARGNLQAWAREQRYGAAAELAAARAADVAAGHTATDQLETILYRLASSPSRRALLGMRPRDGALVRPLLGFTREQTAAYCRARGLEWREDETNASSHYARNRVRAALVPALLDVHPGAHDNVLALAEVLRHEGEVLDDLVEEVLEGRPGVSIERLRSLPVALRRLVVQRLADDAGGRFAPGAARRAEEIAALRDRGTAMLDIGNGLRAIVEYGELRIERLGAAGSAGSTAVTEASRPS
jgi:tRNA(Ile)-lysidine synthase